MKKGNKRKLTFGAGCLCAALAVFLLAAAVISPAGKRHSPQTTISLGHGLAIALRDDGSLVTSCYDGMTNEAESWMDIVSVAAGSSHLVGLKGDGTVAAAGDNGDGQCNVSDMADISSISAGYFHTVGLKKDGTVAAVGDNRYGQCNVSDWTDIVAIDANYYQTIGLKKDGTVVTAGYQSMSFKNDIPDWTDIASISAGRLHTVGLKTNGTAVASGDNSYGQCQVSDWKDIAAVAAGGRHTVGLRKNGTVVAAGENSFGQCQVSDWEHIGVPSRRQSPMRCAAWAFAIAAVLLFAAPVLISACQNRFGKVGKNFDKNGGKL